MSFTDVSGTITFPYIDISRKRRFPDNTFPDNDFPTQTLKVTSFGVHAQEPVEEESQETSEEEAEQEVSEQETSTETSNEPEEQVAEQQTSMEMSEEPQEQLGEQETSPEKSEEPQEQVAEESDEPAVEPLEEQLQQEPSVGVTVQFHIYGGFDGYEALPRRHIITWPDMQMDCVHVRQVQCSLSTLRAGVPQPLPQIGLKENDITILDRPTKMPYRELH